MDDLTKQPTDVLALSAHHSAAIDAGTADLEPAEGPVADERLDTSAMPSLRRRVSPAGGVTAWIVGVIGSRKNAQASWSSDAIALRHLRRCVCRSAAAAPG